MSQTREQKQLTENMANGSVAAWANGEEVEWLDHTAWLSLPEYGNLNVFKERPCRIKPKPVDPWESEEFMRILSVLRSDHDMPLNDLLDYCRKHSAPEKDDRPRREHWVNMYPEGVEFVCRTKKDADRFAREDRTECVHYREVLPGDDE
jgi:hypothetical protein